MQRGCNAFHLCIKGGHLAVSQYLAPKMGAYLHDTDDEGHLGKGFGSSYAATSHTMPGPPNSFGFWEH